MLEFDILKAVILKMYAKVKSGNYYQTLHNARALYVRRGNGPIRI